MHRYMMSIAAVVAVSVCGAQENIAELPGYVEFDAESIFGTGASTLEISLEGPLLSLMASATRQVEPDFAELLAGLKLIRVHIAPYSSEVEDESEEESGAKELVSTLETSGWERVMKMRDSNDAQAIDAFMKMDEDRVEGFTLFVRGDNRHRDEGVFINIVGDIDPEKLGALAAKFLGEDFDADIFEDIAKGIEEDTAKSPVEAARGALKAARDSAGELNEATVTAAEELIEQAERLAADGHNDAAVRLLDAATALYGGVVGQR